MRQNKVKISKSFCSKTASELKDLEKTYDTLYGQELKNEIKKSQSNTAAILFNEGSRTFSEFQHSQEERTLWFSKNKDILSQQQKRLHDYQQNQIADAQRRTYSKEAYNNIKKLIDSDCEINPNRLRHGDAEKLSQYYHALDMEINNQRFIFLMTDIDDQSKNQAKTNIIESINKINKIIKIFSEIITRYDRFNPDQQYDHQIADMKETYNKGLRLISEKPSQQTQERLQLIEKLADLSINTDYLLDLSDEDFQLIYTLLSGKTPGRVASYVRTLQ